MFQKEVMLPIGGWVEDKAVPNSGYMLFQKRKSANRFRAF